MSRTDLDQQVEYPNGTRAWYADVFDTNRIDRSTGLPKRVACLPCAASDEATAYEVAEQKCDLRGIRPLRRTIHIRPASYGAWTATTGSGCSHST